MMIDTHDWKLVLELDDTNLWYCRVQNRYAISGHDEPPEKDEERKILWVNTEKPISLEGRANFGLAGQWGHHDMPVWLDPTETLEIASFLNLEIETPSGAKFVASKTSGNASQSSGLNTANTILRKHGFGCGPFIHVEDVMDEYPDMDEAAAADVIERVEKIVANETHWPSMITRAAAPLAELPT